MYVGLKQPRGDEERCVTPARAAAKETRETQDYAPLQRQSTNNQANSHNFKTLSCIYLQ